MNPRGLWSRPFAPLAGGSSAELACPDHQGALQQSAALQVLEQAGDGKVGLSAVQRVVLDHVAVSVPGVVAVAAAGIDLDEADAPFHQPTGNEALAAEFLRLRVLQSVQAPRGLGFAGQVHGFGSRLLHPERQLVAGDSGHQLAVLGSGGATHPVQAGEQPELVALLGRGDAFLGFQKEDRVPL